MIELRVLGGVELRATDGRTPELILGHEKIFALLAYLSAAHPLGSHRRDTLVALLWPELDQEHARTALRKAIHSLRQALGQSAIVSSGDETVGIAEHEIWCDVREFDKAVHAQRPVDAMALYRGDLLPGTLISDAPEWERWVDRERQELRASGVRAAWMASKECELAGRVAESIRWGRRAHALAPDDEQCARELITLLWRLGDRAGAIRVYDEFERYLVRELAVAPSAETTSLIEKISAESPVASKRAAVSLERNQLSGDRLGIGSVPAFDDPVEPGFLVKAASSHPWRLRAGVTGLIVMLATFAVVFAGRRSSADATPLHQERVAVLALDNETGRPDFEFVGKEVQDWITSGLQQTGLVRVYPLGRDSGNTGSNAKVAGGDKERTAAAGLGAGTLVRGRYYLRSDSILMDVSVVDVAAGNVLATLGPIKSLATDPSAAIETVRQRTMGVLATQIDPALNQWASGTSQPPSFDAYREYSRGEQARARADFDGAIGYYIRAASLDSGYVYPMLMAASLEMQVGSQDSAIALLRTVRARHQKLAPFDDAFADALEAQLAQDFERAYAADQRLRRLAMPGSEWELDAATMAIELNRPRQALEIVKTVDLHRPGVLDRWDVFVPITNAYHLAGENDEMLALLRRDAGRWRNAAFIVVVEMQALSALGRPDEADSLWRTLLHNTPFEKKGIVMWAAWMGASEMRAHGFPAAARHLASEALDSMRALPRGSPWGDPARWRMQVLREAARPAEALVIARGIAGRNPREANMATIVGALSAQLGDTTTARHIQNELLHWPAGDANQLLITRARLAAALGDKGAAVTLLHTACDKGCWSFEDLHIIYEFDGLRSYPAFIEFLRPKPGF